jgi:hypothetical protein
MADYYSLLARAIGAIPQSTPEARQAVYERARKALFNQLRNIQPPVAEADIAAEGRALDEAIARLEAELAVHRQPAAQPPSKSADAKKPPPPPPPKPKDPAPPGRAAAKEIAPARKKEEAAPPQNGVASASATPGEPPREQQRPAAPLPNLPESASRSRRLLAILAIVAVLAGLVALAAWRFRESPEDLAKLKPEDATVEASGGKFSDRIRGEGDEDQQAAAGGAGSSPADKNAPAVPVAQKAELWVASVQEPNKVDKIYAGNVVWRLDNVGGPGEPLSSAIRGDIDFPEAKLKLSLIFRKNTDATLSASHTINVSFKVAPASELKGVKAIGPIQMRRPDAQTGEKVVGIPVPITDNNFLIGLMRGDREARNLLLMRSLMVLDLPLQLSDGRAATISLEKGPAGERVFADAIDNWSHK